MVFEKFLQNKISDSEGTVINFQDEINEVIRIIKENKDELFEDLREEYIFNLEKSKKKK